MSFPIPVDLTVSENVHRFLVSVSESQTAVTVGMESPISVGTNQSYDGPAESMRTDITVR